MRNRLGFGIAVLLALGACRAVAQDGACGPSTQSAYEDSEADLQRLLEDIVAALKSDNKTEAEALARTLLIPEPEPCFKAIFGPAEGPRVAEMYSKIRGFRRDIVPGLLKGSAERSSPQIRVERAKGAPDNRTGQLYAAVLQAMREPATLYAAFYRETVAGDFYSLGPFLYTTSGFRSVDAGALFALSSAPPRRIVIGGNVQQARLLHKASPRYPESAKAAGMQGTVRLQVIIGIDGLIREIEVKSGPAELVDSAVTAVQQWRYQPTLLNGMPVEVVTTVDVEYTLRPVKRP